MYLQRAVYRTTDILGSSSRAGAPAGELGYFSIKRAITYFNN